MSGQGDEMRALIADTAERIFRDRCDRAAVDGAEDGQWPADLWDTLAETGLTAAGIAERSGGAGGTLGDAMAVIRQAGRFAVPLPLAETYLALLALSGAGLGLPGGPLTVALAGAGAGMGAGADGGAVPALRRTDGGWVLSGGARRVPWAARASRIVVVADDGRGPVVAAVAPSACVIAPGANLAGEPRDDVVFADVALADDAVARAGPGIDGAGIDGAGIDGPGLWRLGALARAVLMAGALDAVLAMTVQYAGERVQFGRPIARFQAVQQQMAVLAGEVAASGRAADEAVAAEEDGDGALAIAVAKARVGEAAGRAAEIAHQVHGAIGFTHEYGLNLYTRRLWSWRDEFGAEFHWQAEIGRRVAAAGADGLWPLLSSA